MTLGDLLCRPNQVLFCFILLFLLYVVFRLTGWPHRGGQKPKKTSVPNTTNFPGLSTLTSITCPPARHILSDADLDYARPVSLVELAKSAVTAKSPARTARNAISPARIVGHHYLPSRPFPLLLLLIQRLRITSNASSRIWHSLHTRLRRPRQFRPCDSRPIRIRISATTTIPLRMLQLHRAMAIMDIAGFTVAMNMQIARILCPPRHQIP